MKPVFSRAEAQAFDQASIAAGVPSLLLMENAGRGAAEVIARLFPAGKALVVCGSGNNGGDGYVVARRLCLLGWQVTLFAPSPPRTEDAKAMARALPERVQVLSARVPEFQKALGMCSVLVDALFGTGLTRPLAGADLELVGLMNASNKICVSLDLPSGIDADTGAILGGAVSAHHTVCFAAHKRGVLAGAGRIRAGSVHVADIGVSAEGASASAALFEAPALAPRATDVHKFATGHVAIVGGSTTMEGAAALCGRGALRAGAGVVTIAAPLAFSSMPEVMHQPDLSLALARAHVAVVGPGLGRTAEAKAKLSYVLEHWRKPLVVDADALTLFAEAPRKLDGSVVFTPHAGELARLLKMSAEEVEADRFAAVSTAAERFGVTVLLKGPCTLVASSGKPTSVNPTGGPALATAGSGDVLSGAIAALLHERGPYEAATLGAYLHGASLVDRGDRGALASEIADGIARAIQLCLASVSS